MDGHFTWGPPKTEAGRRTVTLPAVAAAALAEHLSAYSEPGPEGLVFTSAEGGCCGGASSTGGCGARPPLTPCMPCSSASSPTPGQTRAARLATLSS
jgi:hypothetical protein